MSAWPWLVVPATYLIGSLSPAYWAGRFKGIDLREHGSKSLGATNAGRVLGKQWFFIVFTLDVAKGLLPVLAAKWAAESAGFAPDAAQGLAIATAVAAVLGHVFTCWHRFKGGKAVATSLGVLVALAWWVAAGGFAIWLVVWLIGRLAFRAGAAGAVGPASVLAAVAAPVIQVVVRPDPWRMPELPLTVFVLLLAILVVAKHHKNIAKLFAPKPPV